MRELLRRLDDALSSGGERIVCQVVETKGSTPQKAGALMVVDPDGGQAGTPSRRGLPKRSGLFACGGRGAAGMLSCAAQENQWFGGGGLLGVAAHDNSGSLPPELLWGVSWTFRGEPFADRAAFDAAVAEYQDPDRGEVWRPDEFIRRTYPTKQID